MRKTGITELTRWHAKVHEQVIGMTIRDLIAHLFERLNHEGFNGEVLLSFPLNVLVVVERCECGQRAQHIDVAHTQDALIFASGIGVPKSVTNAHAGQTMRFENERVIKTFINSFTSGKAVSIAPGSV